MSFFQTENVLQFTTNESLVGCRISDGRTVFSIIEYITKRYKKKDSAYDYNIFSRLKAKPQYKEFEEYVVDGKLGGNKKSMTPSTCVITSVVGDLGGRCPAASSAPNEQLLRQALAQQYASGGVSIAAPPDQVLAVRIVYSCASVTLFDHGPACAGGRCAGLDGVEVAWRVHHERRTSANISGNRENEDGNRENQGGKDGIR